MHNFLDTLIVGFFPLPENLFLHEVNKPLCSIGLSMSGARVLPQINVFIMHIFVLPKQITKRAI